jgi:hypothetical protein
MVIKKVAKSSAMKYFFFSFHDYLIEEHIFICIVELRGGRSIIFHNVQIEWNPLHQKYSKISQIMKSLFFKVNYGDTRHQ